MMKLHELPVIITDKNGTIKSINEAAHRLCAALCIGSKITSLLSDENKLCYDRAVMSLRVSFSLPSVDKKVSSLLFDLSKISSHGIITVYITKNPAQKSFIDYSIASLMFSEAISESGFSGKRRFTELYETLRSRNSVFGANYEKKLYSFKSMMDNFLLDILPRHLYFGGDIVYTEDDSVNPYSIIFAEVYSFYLLLCAMISVAAHLTEDTVYLKSLDRGDKIEIEITCRTKNDVVFSPTDFGPRTADFIYAMTLSSISGHELSYSQKDSSFVFSLSVFSYDYYPSYLKADTGSDFTLSAAAMSIIYPTDSNTFNKTEE